MDVNKNVDENVAMAKTRKTAVPKIIKYFVEKTLRLHFHFCEILWISCMNAKKHSFCIEYPEWNMLFGKECCYQHLIVIENDWVEHLIASKI